jgi:hypothetical protein
MCGEIRMNGVVRILLKLISIAQQIQVGPETLKKPFNKKKNYENI